MPNTPVPNIPMPNIPMPNIPMPNTPVPNIPMPNIPPAPIVFPKISSIINPNPIIPSPLINPNLDSLENPSPYNQFIPPPISGSAYAKPLSNFESEIFPSNSFAKDRRSPKNIFSSKNFNEPTYPNKDQNILNDKFLNNNLKDSSLSNIPTEINYSEQLLECPSLNSLYLKNYEFESIGNNSEGAKNIQCCHCGNYHPSENYNNIVCSNLEYCKICANCRKINYKMCIMCHRQYSQYEIELLSVL